MEPGTHTTRESISSISNFLEGFALLYGAHYWQDTSGQTRSIGLSFPDDWRGLHVSVKFPLNSMFPNLDITIRSAVNDPTLICTKDEGMAKVFLTTAIQMFEPPNERVRMETISPS